MSSINNLATPIAQRSLVSAIDRPGRALSGKDPLAEASAGVPAANSTEASSQPMVVGKALPARQEGRVSAEDEAALAKTVERLNDQAASLNRSIKFSVDKETGRTVIKVVDRETEEVIRQIPPEYTMEILRRMEIGAGVLLEEQA